MAKEFGRRDFLMRMTALGVAGAPVVSTLWPAPAHPNSMTGGAPMKTAYDPAARFDLKVSEVEFRRASSGRMLMARAYQPQGAGPFPALLDLHGGAWNNKDRLANEPMDGAVATSGVLGSSSGGHIAELLGMRPREARYNAIPLPAAPNLDATVAYVATRSPISDTYARYQQAEKMKRDGMIKNNKTYFVPWDTIFEGNPQHILDRREAVMLPPLLIMQGALDDNVLPAVQEKFGASYRAAGGECEVHVFEGCEHEWIAKPGPQTDRAHEMVKGFIARNVAAVRRAP